MGANSQNTIEVEDFVEHVDADYLKQEFEETERTIEIDIWISRVVAIGTAVGALYVGLGTFPDISGFLLACLMGFSTILALVHSERTMQIMMKSATPIIILDGKLKLRATSIDKLRGWDGLIDIHGISHISIRRRMKPHSRFELLLRRMGENSCELKVVTAEGKNRFSGPKPCKTINKLVDELNIRYNIRIS